MSYDPGAIGSALSAAVGDDPALVADLRRAFIESAMGHLETLGRVRSEADWRAAAWRLQGLAASFGAARLTTLAEQAAMAQPGDLATLSGLGAAIAQFAD